MEDFIESGGDAILVYFILILITTHFPLSWQFIHIVYPSYEPRLLGYQLSS
jgi:hypothetical protein